MYLMKVPSRRNPIASRISPDRNVARISPSTPCCCDRRRDQHDEGAGRAADLEAAAAERRDDEAADDRRCRARGPASRPMRWRSPWTAAARRWRPSGPRRRRPCRSRKPVALAQNRDELRREQLDETGLVGMGEHRDPFTSDDRTRG